MPSHFRVTSSPDGLHLFALMGDDDRQLVQSVLHRSMEQLLETMNLVRQAVTAGQACQPARSLDGQHYYEVRSSDGALLASSPLYGDLDALRADVAELHRIAADARSVQSHPRNPAAGRRNSLRAFRRMGDPG